MAERSWIIERDGIAAADTAEWGRIAERDDVVECTGLSGEMALPSGMVLLQLTPPSRTELLNRIKLPNRVNSKYGR